MQLSKTTPAQKFDIKMPIWHARVYADKPRAVGLDVDNLGKHNEINILYANKDGKRIWPQTYYFDGDLRIFFATQERKGRTLLIVPIDALQILERI